MIDANYVYPDIARYTDAILSGVRRWLDATSIWSVEKCDANLAN
jgi:hypothetical protein